MDAGTQFKCHRIKVEANSLLLRSPSLPRVVPLSLSLQGSRAFVSRANEGVRCGLPCPVCPVRQPARVYYVQRTPHDLSKIVFDDPCPPSLVPPASSVASCRSHRRGTHSEEVVLSHSSPRYARNQRAGIRMAPGSAPREETGQEYYASCTGACLHAQKLLGGPPG